jgi:hypothetical protein
MDAPPTANLTDDTLAVGELHYLAENHDTEWGRDNCLKWRQRVASIIPADQRTTPVPRRIRDPMLKSIACRLRDGTLHLVTPVWGCRGCTVGSEFIYDGGT